MKTMHCEIVGEISIGRRRHVGIVYQSRHSTSPVIHTMSPQSIHYAILLQRRVLAYRWFG